MKRRLSIKLATPHPSHQPIRRPRLVELLAGARQARLVLLSAPPGFGKTTALIDWLEASDLATSWISLDEADNDPVRFLRYLWAAATKLSSEDDVGPIEEGAPSVDARAAIAELATMVAARPDPAVLVLDDYHVITAPAVHEAIGLLVEALPPQAHLAIATRADPPLPLARLRARGELLELRANELRFTQEEAQTFFAERMGLTLSDADVATLVSRTEGWPAVLQLAGLSLAGRTDIAKRVRDFNATHRFVLDYITDEVLGVLDANVRDFLVATSVLDRLTGPLCDELTGGSDGQAMLERLERANLLLVPLDERRRWYRYHHLFADLLRTRLGTSDRAQPAALHRRAADWYERQGFVGEAIEHALRAGDEERARRLIAQASADLVHAAEYETLRGWLDRLPEALVCSDALLSSRYAWTLVLAGRTDGVEGRLADAEAAMPTAIAAGEPAERIPAHVALIRSIAARIGGDLPAAIAHAERALALVPAAPSPANDALVADARAILGHALLEAGDLGRAVDAYRAARPVEERARNWIAVADITRNHARLEARRGRVHAALEECDTVLATLARVGAVDLPAVAPVHLARAEVLARLGDHGAVAAAERAMELARRGGDAVTLREARSVRDRAAAHRAIGDATPKRLVEPLTERELEVLQLVGAGRSNRQIAAELYVTVGTVKTHVHAITGKLGAANRVEAVALARGLDLLQPATPK
jgi:LuxR family maltose regulon positive regulatory protein